MNIFNLYFYSQFDIFRLATFVFTDLIWIRFLKYICRIFFSVTHQTAATSPPDKSLPSKMLMNFIYTHYVGAHLFIC